MVYNNSCTEAHHCLQWHKAALPRIPLLWLITFHQLFQWQQAAMPRHQENLALRLTTASRGSKLNCRDSSSLSHCSSQLHPVTTSCNAVIFNISPTEPPHCLRQQQAALAPLPASLHCWSLLPPVGVSCNATNCNFSHCEASPSNHWQQASLSRLPSLNSNATHHFPQWQQLPMPHFQTYHQKKLTKTGSGSKQQ